MARARRGRALCRLVRRIAQSKRTGRARIAFVGRATRTHQLRKHLRDYDSAGIAARSLARGNNRGARRVHNGASDAAGRRFERATRRRRSRRRADHDDPQKQGTRSGRRRSLRRIFRKHPSRSGQYLSPRQRTASCDRQTGAGHGEERDRKRKGGRGSTTALRRTDPRARETRFEPLFTTETVFAPASADSADAPEKAENVIDEEALAEWFESTSRPVVPESEFNDLGVKHRGLIIESYTSLQAAEPDEFKTSVDALEARADNVDLPGGRQVGIFLHEAIEQLDFKSFDDAPDLQSWMARDDVRELFASTMRRHGVDDPRWLERGREIVFNTLTSRVALGKSVFESGLHRLPSVREMEFAYPIPETHH